MELGDQAAPVRARMLSRVRISDAAFVMFFSDATTCIQTPATMSLAFCDYGS